jgi:hypothetical protein
MYRYGKEIGTCHITNKGLARGCTLEVQRAEIKEKMSREWLRLIIYCYHWFHTSVDERRGYFVQTLKSTKDDQGSNC